MKQVGVQLPTAAVNVILLAFVAERRAAAAPGGRRRVSIWYGTVNVDLYSAIITKVSNALNTLVSGEMPGFQTLSKGLVVLLCAEAVRQRVPDHGAVPAGLPAANPPRSIDGTDRLRLADRQTDGHRTVTQTLPHTMRTVSITGKGTNTS